MLHIHGFPSNIEEWEKMQRLIWPDHEALPAGWIRVWSRSRGQEYYLRVEDGYASFDLEPCDLCEIARDGPVARRR